MRAHGITDATKRDPGKLVSDFLAMVGFGSVEAYGLGVANMLSSVATLKESGKQVDPASMMAWIALGKEVESAMADELVAYEPDALKASLAELRARVAATDPDTLRDIARILARSGVILQFVEAPTKFPLHGVTRRTADGNPVIQLTGRRKEDGYIIWTLFHELGHILNDGNTGMTVSFIEGQGARAPKSDAEKRANAFAKEALLGPGGSRPTTASAILRASKPPPRQGARAPASSSTSCTATTRSFTDGATTFWRTWTSRSLAKPRCIV